MKKVTVKGLNVVITGEIDGLSREAAIERLERAGAHVQTRFRNSTDLLVIGDNIDDRLRVDGGSRFGRGHMTRKVEGAIDAGIEIVRWPQLRLARA